MSDCLICDKNWEACNCAVEQLQSDALSAKYPIGEPQRNIGGEYVTVKTAASPFWKGRN